EPARQIMTLPPPPPPPDASLKEALGAFEIYSVPPGAMVTVADTPLGAAPRIAKVTPGVKLRVKLELKGYQTSEEDYEVEPNKALVIRQKLEPAPATLSVETAPPGAQVTAGGQFLGSTPLEKPLPAGKAIEVMITKAGYDPIKLAADLTAGETTAIKRDLRETTKLGHVTINVSGTAGWADVYFRGTKLGRNRTASGLVEFTLPVGAHTLRLRAGNGKVKTLNVTIAAGQTATLAATFE
ncbi:MAG TPA: PEGA domain-containing protein, partial [Kofleriaceae bacterium]|nr:PEGA domain-containing protein [Kofleriaceae bacterium]